MDIDPTDFVMDTNVQKKLHKSLRSIRMAPKTLEEGSKYAHFDKDGDGVITDEEFMLEREMMRQKMRTQRRSNQKNAWFALWGLLVYPIGIIIADVVGYETTGQLLADIAPTYFVAISALVGAFFGAQAYAKVKK